MLVLTAADIRRALPMRAAIDSQRKAFIALATDQAQSPMRNSIAIPEEDAVTLFMPARTFEHVGLKIASVFPKNPARGLPAVPGAVILMDQSTGQPLALMEATYLTALRTGAASGLATDLLASPEACSAAIIGTGGQAITQLLAICTVRSLESVRVYSRNPDHAQSFIERMQSDVTPSLRLATSVADALEGVDIVCTATTSANPVVVGRHLKPGVHVNGIGSFTVEMQEVDTETVRRAGRVFVDSRRAALSEAGDVVIPLRDGIIRENDVVELGAVAGGLNPGRTSQESITFFKSVGVAVQDIAAAGEVLRRARELRLGREIEL